MCKGVTVFDFVFQVVRGVSTCARSLGDASVDGVFEHTHGGTQPTAAGPSGLSAGV